VDEQKAREILYRLNPVFRLDTGPRVVHLARNPEVGELCQHATGYHVDPYGVLFRTDLRVADTVDLIKDWDIVAQIPEVRTLLDRLIGMNKEGLI
jgi:hypothetical protein